MMLIRLLKTKLASFGLLQQAIPLFMMAGFLKNI